MLALVLLCLAAPGRFDRINARTPDGRSDRGFSGSQHALLEFAPANGAGMGAACACAAVTGAGGEALTMTRGSPATCSKQGAATSGIAPGDLVTCANDLPRIEAVGLSLGYLREGAATNVDPRSSELDDAAYGDFTGGGSAAPVLNGADAARAPDNTVSAEDYTFDATTAAQGSARAISVLTAAAYSAQAWVRGVTGSGAIDLCLQTGAAPTATCSTCAFTTSSWSQCKVENVTAIAGGQVFVGNLGLLTGITRPVNRVYVWGVDAEAGAWASSYIPTAGATATRAADSALTGYASTTWGPDFSLSASVAFVDTSASTTTAAQLGSATPNLAAVKTTNNTTAAYTIDSVSTGPTVAAMGSTQHRTALADATGSRGAWWDTISVAAPAASITSWFNGAIDTAVTYVPGKLGLAGSFDGVSSSIATEPLLKPSSWSMNCWLYQTTASADTYGCAWNIGNASAAGQCAYWIRVGAGSTTWQLFNGSTGTVTATIPFNTWTMSTVTFDGTNARSYVNGSLVSGPIAHVINSATGPVWMGRLNGYTTYDYSGLIDNVMMWNRELSAGDVASLYGSGSRLEAVSGSLAIGLIHEWRLNGNSFDDYGQASITIGAANARTSAVCADPNPARCR